jgi:hypothetical protein
VKLFAIAALWLWTGFVSCDDPDKIAAAVRAEVGDGGAEQVTCQEPRLWASEDDWACRVYFRGNTRCFKAHDLLMHPWEIECPKASEQGHGLVLPQ